ncbi:FMN-binding negative transcriptional regulator [Nonomuraea sp. NBC_01738]|uniref:FMN-binding negative transcriptional regulator n=1 Tax=Nonomuraea sp. NBC_01738 TaxID=2976003 RepID=UPI002E135B76|nr:FMN-binding negative transcriptional regulator [Nonomuraea sp. NBC_01738]
MYVPHYNAMDDPGRIGALVAAVGSATLITTGPDGYLAATLLPVIWDDDRLIFHMARANQHWKTLSDDLPALAVVTGPEAYISPSWYAAKAEHGRVVPTWNYSAVHFTGRLRIHHEPEWLLDAVTRLVDRHERPRRAPWAVDDAPEAYVAKQVRAIVGIEFAIERVEGKAKLSQNRSAADRDGVIAGLRAESEPRAHQVADAMSEETGAAL